MPRTLLPGALATGFTFLSPPAFAQHSQNQLPQPTPRLVVRDARIPVRLESVDLRAEVIGHAVQTRRCSK